MGPGSASPHSGGSRAPKKPTSAVSGLFGRLEVHGHPTVPHTRTQRQRGLHTAIESHTPTHTSTDRQTLAQTNIHCHTDAEIRTQPEPQQQTATQPRSHTHIHSHPHTHTHTRFKRDEQADRQSTALVANESRPAVHTPRPTHTHTHTHTLIPHMQMPPMPRRVPLALTKPLPPSIHTPGAGSSSSRSLHATLASSMYLRSHVKTTSATHPS